MWLMSNRELYPSLISGEQGLRWFLLNAFKQGWNILALEQHNTPEDPRDLNVTEQLLTIKASDARVIIMFTVIKYAPYIFRLVHK